MPCFTGSALNLRWHRHFFKKKYDTLRNIAFPVPVTQKENNLFTKAYFTGFYQTPKTIFKKYVKCKLIVFQLLSDFFSKNPLRHLGLRALPVQKARELDFS